MNTILELDGVSFSYGGGRNVVDSLSLGVEEGSFTTLLGSSGCGKTTLLRLVCGFLRPTAGDVRIGGRSQRGIPPNERAVGMVFQDYALFPHMTVRQNIAYGLKIRRLSRAQIESEVGGAAEKLGISDLLPRIPSELSGGQQQRVALARAVVLRPRILLMDEPLSSLDTLLREKVRSELKEIQRLLGITTVYVTHDQDEAMSLSDRIAVIDGGRLVQYGSPRDIYFSPATRFAAESTGRANFIGRGGRTELVRPEWLSLCAPGEPGDVEGTLAAAEFLGGTTRLRVRAEFGDVTAEVPTLSLHPLRDGDRVSLRILRSAEIPQD